MRTLESLDVAGRRVLVRADLNVPLAEGAIADDRRIRAAVPTVRRLLEAGGHVVLLAHLGRPKGVPDQALSLAPVAARLGELVESVIFVPDTVGDTAVAAAEALGPGQLAVLENVRFDPRETSKDAAERRSLAHQYARLGEVFVSDGFGVLHREQASVFDVAQLMPSAAGELVEAEVAVLRQLSTDPRRPYVVVLGGAKVSDKLAVIRNLLDRVDRLVVGGGMAFTFLAAEGCSTGTSLLEVELIETVRGLLRRAKDIGVEIVLPEDVVTADRFAADAEPVTVPADQIPEERMGLDIGPRTQERFAAAIADAHTVFWNGPMGVFEFPAFAAGTRAVAQAVADVEGLSVVGGGDSAAAVRQLGFPDEVFGHISTGGGASLEYLEGKTLPGLAVLGDGGA